MDDSGLDCFKAVVDCVALDKKHKKKIEKGLIQIVRKNGYDYVFSFSERLLENEDLRKLSYATRSKNLYTYNPLIGFRFTMMDAPGFDVGAFITDHVIDRVLNSDNKMNLDPLFEYKANIDLFNTRLSARNIDRVDLPVFLEDMLKVKCLIIVDKEYKDYCSTIEEYLIHYIKEEIRLNLLEKIKSRVEYAKADAVARTTLDSVGIDWRSYPNDVIRGVKHDNEISNAFELVLRTSKKGTTIEEFSEEYCNNLSFNELCELFYKNINWKMFYDGKLNGNETDFFYKDSDDKKRLTRADISSNNKLYKRCPNGLLDLQLKLIEEDCDMLKELEGILSYYRYVVGIDEDIVKQLSKQFGIKYKNIKNIRPNCSKMPNAVNIKEVKKKKCKKLELDKLPVCEYEKDYYTNGAIENCYSDYKFFELIKKSEREEFNSICKLK